MTMTNTTTPKGNAKRPRKPHNARRSTPTGSVGDLARSVGAEPRKAIMGGKEVIISLAERLARKTVESAIGGSVSDLKLLIQTMIKHPQIAASARERWVLVLGGNDARL